MRNKGNIRRRMEGCYIIIGKGRHGKLSMCRRLGKEKATAIDSHSSRLSIDSIARYIDSLNTYIAV